MYVVIGIVLFYLLLKILKVPFRIIKKLMINGLCGMVIIWIFNLIGGIINLNIELNTINALIAGIFGVPGILLILLIN